MHTLSFRNFRVLFISVFSFSLIHAEQINPFPRGVISSELAREWVFTDGLAGWQGLHDCSLAAEGGVLKVVSSSSDPYFGSGPMAVQGPMVVRIEARTTVVTQMQMFYSTDKVRAFTEKMSARTNLIADGAWHVYELAVRTDDEVQRLRIDPGSKEGLYEFRSVRIVEQQYHPLEIVEVHAKGDVIEVGLKNYGKEAIDYQLGDQKGTVGPEGLETIRVLGKLGERCFSAAMIDVESDGLPALKRPVFLYQVGGKGDFGEIADAGVTVRVEKSGAYAELAVDGDVVAVMAPVVHVGGVVPAMKVGAVDGKKVELVGDGVTVGLSVDGGKVNVEINSKLPCEGPVVRVIGGLEQGLLAGLEYLGKGEASSSKLDIETDEHLRYRPDVMKVTMPLMVCATDKGTAALMWEDMMNQPTYAVPNFYDGTDDHRMGLEGKRIRAKILVKKGMTVEDAVAWYLKEKPLPVVPARPRTWEEEKALCMACLDGPARSEKGWGHCVEDHWARAPFADQASTVWRLTGKLPEFANYQLGGAHIRNDSIFFVTGKAKDWLANRKGQVEGVIRAQQPDGSFRYNGEYQRGHFEDTASGFCAFRAMLIMEYAWYTGDDAARAAGVKALEYMKRFRTPRGAQTWEVALHTPDILGSAYLVWAYVRGYEVTGDESYLAEARRWALSGVPFVYLWGNKPVMVYGTIAVFGATNWVAPNWMGLPVQWCGLDYAYALLMLEKYDDSQEWGRLAEGILVAGEQMQLKDGDQIGALPDSWDLEMQVGRPWMINPCAFASIEMMLRGQVDSLAVGVGDGYRVIAPYAVKVRDGKAYIDAVKGVTYQLLVNNERVIEVNSVGKDIVELK